MRQFEVESGVFNQEKQKSMGDVGPWGLSFENTLPSPYLEMEKWNVLWKSLLHDPDLSLILIMLTLEFESP